MCGNFDRLIGAEAPEAFRCLVESIPNLASVSTFSYAPPPPLQARVSLTLGEQAIIDRALTVRQEYDLPFWDAIMLTSFRTSTDVANLLDASMLHRRHDPVAVTRRGVLDGALMELCRTHDDEMVAVTSRVMLDNGDARHIPLMDFHCPVSDGAMALVSAVLRRLLPDGAILLNSGQSYHAYGWRLLDGDEFLDFLARAILFAPIIDRAYCAHKWLERMSALRISRGGRAKQVPRVIAVL